MAQKEGVRLKVCLLHEGRLECGGAELLDTPGPKWIDVENPDEKTLLMLAERYKLHRLAIEDCLHLDQRPKLEEYPDHQFVVMQTFELKPSLPRRVELHEMHFFLGADWLISVHSDHSEPTEAALKRVVEEWEKTIARGVDFVLYMIADAMVDQVFPIIDALNDDLEELEDRIFQRPDRTLLERAFGLKRTLGLLRRVMSPQRDVVGLLARAGIRFVTERTTLYFRDVYDHLARMHERIDAARDVLANAMDAYLSILANRTGDITKQLTIFATIFLPLSFITSFFGQNFDVLSSDLFLWLMLLSVFLLPVGMLIWFRRKKWI